MFDNACIVIFKGHLALWQICIFCVMNQNTWSTKQSNLVIFSFSVKIPTKLLLQVCLMFTLGFIFYFDFLLFSSENHIHFVKFYVPNCLLAKNLSVEFLWPLNALLRFCFVPTLCFIYFKPLTVTWRCRSAEKSSSYASFGQVAFVSNSQGIKAVILLFIIMLVSNKYCSCYHRKWTCAHDKQILTIVVGPQAFDVTFHNCPKYM